MKKFQISNFRFQVSPQKGFTLIEVLVVAAILGVIGYMMSDILSRSLQGSQKTAVISTAKQNGQVLLDSLSEVIRNSDQVVCVGGALPNPTGPTAGDNLVVYTQNGQYVRFTYPVTIGTNTTMGEDVLQVNSLINNDSSNPLSMQANLCNPSVYPLSNATLQTLTDTNQTNGVLIQKTGGNSIFTVTKRPGSSDSVTMQFDVKPSITGGGFQNQLGGTGAVSFQQTVQLR